MQSQLEIQLPADNWKPRTYQLPLWTYLENGGKRAVQVAHRRWGKDEVALHYTCISAFKRVGNYWHMLPQINQARKVVWNAINPNTGRRRIDDIFPDKICIWKHEQEMAVKLKNGSIWQLVGSDNYNTIVGAPPVGIVFSEWAIANPMAWPYLSPILLENKGWALFIYTARPTKHAIDTYNFSKQNHAWFGNLQTVDDTKVFEKKDLEEEKIQLMKLHGDEFGEAMFLQEYYCSFTGAVLGAYFSKQIIQARNEGRITKVPWTPAIEVDTFWDLGIDDSMTIWFMQPIGKSYNFIDYYEASGFGLEHYAKLLKSKPYVYGNHWMPHDAAEREMTNSEVAKSRKQVAEDLGIRPIQIVPRARNMDVVIQVHIPAVRNILSQCWFDEIKCAGGISALENYKAEYDEDKKKLDNRPVHDWATHGADAFRTFAVGYENQSANKSFVKSLNKPSISNYGDHGWMM